MKNLNLLLSLAALTALCALPAAAQAGSVGGDGAAASPAFLQSQPAPIVRQSPAGAEVPNPATASRPAVRRASAVTYSQPVAGVYVSVAARAAVTTVAAAAGHTELRVDRGVANVNVHQPQKDSEILVDLPGGQVSLLKDGLYTFNADTKTVRVLKGEAVAYAAADANGKGVKVKEDHQVVFGGAQLRAVDAEPNAERADLLPVQGFAHRGGGYGFRGEPAYWPGYGPYGDGFYGGYPAYGYYDGFYPYGFYGYPYVGFGFGYYGFGGFRGGYGGFRGRR